MRKEKVQMEVASTPISYLNALGCSSSLFIIIIVFFFVFFFKRKVEDKSIQYSVKHTEKIA